MTPVQTPVDLRPLTALRFMAALWVALYTFWPNLDVGFLPNLAAKGYLGVELFFVLSGFILSHVYLHAFAEKRFSYRGFLWARIARVYPLHVFTLLGVMALGLAAVAVGLSIDASILSWKSLPAHLLMLHAWGFAGEAGWNHPSWSISAEWFAYLAFPLFALAAWPLRKRPWVATAGAAVFLMGLYAAFEQLAGFPLTEATFRWGALRIVPCFAYGCALYLVYRRAPLPRAGLLILALASIPDGKAGWLGSKPAVYLGEISYSVYMVCAPWQILAVNLAARATGADDKRLHVLVWLGVILGLIVAAAATYHLIERPARKALRGMAERRRPPVDHAAKQSETVLQPSDTIV